MEQRKSNSHSNTTPETELKDIEVSKIDITTEILEKRTLVNNIFETPFLPYKKSVKALHFSKHIQKLSYLYSACLSVQKYNKSKDLKSIYIKSKSSMEKMIKEKISIIDFERLHTLFDIKFKKINILHEGKDVETFTFEVPEIDYDCVFWDYIKKHYQDYLDRNELVHIGNRFIESFNVNLIEEIPRKHIFETISIDLVTEKTTEKTTLNIPEQIVTRGIAKAKTILERIKEKEKNRKEQFMRMSNDKELLQRLKTRIEQLFAIENRNSLKIEKVIKLLNLHDGCNVLKKVCNEYDTFEIRITSNGMFLYKKENM